MAVDFSAFDEQVDLEELQKEVQDAPETNFTDVPDGEYEVSFDNMEIKETKAKDKLMFSVQCNILDERFSLTGRFPEILHRSGRMQWRSSQLLHGWTSWKQRQSRNL